MVEENNRIKFLGQVCEYRYTHLGVPGLHLERHPVIPDSNLDNWEKYVKFFHVFYLNNQPIYAKQILFNVEENKLYEMKCEKYNASFVTLSEMEGVTDDMLDYIRGYLNIFHRNVKPLPLEIKKEESRK